jgi:hypothetical protein
MPVIHFSVSTTKGGHTMKKSKQLMISAIVALLALSLAGPAMARGGQGGGSMGAGMANQGASVSQNATATQQRTKTQQQQKIQQKQQIHEQIRTQDPSTHIDGEPQGIGRGQGGQGGGQGIGDQQRLRDPSLHPDTAPTTPVTEPAAQ